VVRIESPRPLSEGGPEVQHRRLRAAELLAEVGA
jgi:hypothetical protein